MKLRHTIKQLNQSRRMYRRLFREAALNVHPTSRKQRNQLTTTAFTTTAAIPKSYRRIILNPKPGSTRNLKAPKHRELHASKDTKFGITTSGVVVTTNLLDHNFKPVIGMLILFPGSNRYKPTPTRNEISTTTG